MTPTERRRIIKESYEGVHELCKLISMMEAVEE